MNDDELIGALGETARAMESEHEGELGGPEAAIEPADRARIEALQRPLDDIERARMHAAALAAMGVARRPPAAGTSAIRRGLLALVPLAAAAAFVFVASSHRSVLPLPAYGVDVTTADVASRGAPRAAAAGTTAAPLVVSGDRLIVVARPAVPVTGAITARVFAARAGEAREIQPRVTISSEGAVRVEGRLRDLFAPPEGEWDLVVAIGREGASGLSPAQAMAPNLDLPGWTRVRTELKVEP